MKRLVGLKKQNNKFTSKVQNIRNRLNCFQSLKDERGFRQKRKFTRNWLLFDQKYNVMDIGQILA
jgi:hypothetical protein